MRLLLRLLQRCRHRQMLLPGPPLQFEGVSKLCAGVEENGSLKRLNLSWNGLETAGCQRVGKV